MSLNKNPEQKARDIIDKMLNAAGWIVQPQKRMNLSVGKGVAVMELKNSAGKADYTLFVNRKPVGIIEAKAEDEGIHLVGKVEEQSNRYAKAKLRYLNNAPLPYVYESTGTVTRFTNYDDPKARSRRAFYFHRPETLRSILNE